MTTFAAQPTRSEPDGEELEALLARCAGKDAAAFEALYQCAAPRLLAVLVKMLRRRDLAEDVLQDVFVKVWEQAGQYDRIRGRPLARNGAAVGAADTAAGGLLQSLRFIRRDCQGGGSANCP